MVLHRPVELAARIRKLTHCRDLSEFDDRLRIVEAARESEIARVQGTADKAFHSIGLQASTYITEAYY
jgi:hypothetical protein